MMVHVFSVVFSSMPTRDFTSQKPESLKWEHTVAPPATAAVVQARYRGDRSPIPGIAATIPAAMVIATVAEPTQIRTNAATINARTTRGSIAVEAFGEPEPVATVAGQAVHVIELSRFYATDEAIRDNIDFHSLSGFSLVICKPDKKIIYTDCQWSAIQESAEIGSMVMEKVTLVASRRIETEA